MKTVLQTVCKVLGFTSFNLLGPVVWVEVGALFLAAYIIKCVVIKAMLIS